MEQVLEMEREISAIKAKQAAADEQHKTIFNRLDKQDRLLESVQSLASSVGLLAQKQNTIEEKVDGLVEDVDEIKDKPGKRWDSAVEKIIMTVIAAVAGFLLARLGL